MSWLADNKDAIDALVKIVATLFAVFGGGWGLYQYFKGSQLRAAENLLKMEDEFRCILGTYAQIEDVPTYERLIRPVLQAEATGQLNDASLKTLTELDRCLRFLYLCSVMNEALRIDQAFGVPGGALRRAYYHYIAILLPEERKRRPELLAYTDREYRRLTAWIGAHASELRTLSPARRGDRSTWRLRDSIAGWFRSHREPIRSRKVSEGVAEERQHPARVEDGEPRNDR